MSHIFLSLLLTFLFINTVFAQISVGKDAVVYKTKIIQDTRIEKLNENYTSLYKLEGYRIQLYSGNKKQPARQVRLEFSQLYRDIKAHESYQQPYFKVRVGDFRTKIEALNFQKELQDHFPNCFIVTDEIEIGELLK